MKRFLLFLILICLICSCSYKTVESVSDSELDKTIDYSQIWVVDPVFEFDDITVDFNCNKHLNIDYLENEFIRNVNTPYELYENGGLIVSKKGLIGVLDGSGNLKVQINNESYFKVDKGINDMCLFFVSPYNNLGPNSREGWFYLNSDYSVEPTIKTYGAIGPKQHFTVKNDGTMYLFYVDDFTFGIVENDAAYTDQSYTYLIKSYLYEDGGISEGNGYIDGYVVLNKSSYNLLNVSEEMMARNFTSNIARFSYEDGKNTTYIDSNGRVIVEGYDDGGDFFEGIAPVKKDGKWGYIDTNGNVIIDSVFDKATELCDGKAWVIYNGRTGRIDISYILDNDITLDEETLRVSNYKVDDLGMKYICILADSIRLRSEPSTSGNLMGRVEKGNILPYFETVKEDDYTWYRIGIDCWVADKNGEWVEELE